jgi:hypothetical protein
MSTELAQVMDAPPPVRRWTERQVQDAVYVHCAIKNHEIIVPNSCVLGWEADVVSVNRTGFISEFEIKVSRADFKAEAKKAHRRLLTDPVQHSTFFGSIIHPRPNYFFFAVPEGLIEPEEVPDYAGLIYVHKRVEAHRLYYGTASQVKAAKRLHRDRINDGQRIQLARALTMRYWRQRLNALLAHDVQEPSAGRGDICDS